MAAQGEKYKTELALHWSPRELNIEADALSNEDHSGLSDSLRVPVEMETCPWLVLGGYMDEGMIHQKQLEQLRKEKREAGAATVPKQLAPKRRKTSR